MYTTLLHLLPPAILLHPLLTSGLHIGKSSPCRDECDGGVNTETKHLSCLDAAYDPQAGTASGKTMRTCLECTEKSTYANASDTETDQYWFMFHLKYTQQFCLFDGSSPQISDCSTECAPLRGPLTDLWADTTPPQFLYEYCDHSSRSYPVYAPDCAACLKARSGTVVLANFMETMSSACGNKPNVSTTGALFDIKAANGNLFDTETQDATTSTAPTATDDTAAATPSTNLPAGTTPTSGNTTNSAATTPAADDTNTASTSSQQSSSSLSTGATIGIGVGVGILAAALIAGLVFWVLRRRRAKRNSPAAVGESRNGDETSGFVQGPGSQYSSSGSGSGGMGYANDDQKFGYGYGHGYQQEMPAGSGRPPVEMSAQGMVSEMATDGHNGKGAAYVAELPAGAGRVS